MWKTVLFLILTILVIPFFAFKNDVPLTDLQSKTIIPLVWIYIVSAGLCFIVSTITKNYSQVDKLWSLIPIVYVWVAAYYFGFEARVTIMAVLVTIWGLRLSYNFARRGGYKLKFWEGEEDYRWEVLRAKPEFKGELKWILFNLFFISYYQMGLILLFTLPIVKSIGGTTIGVFDIILALIFVGLVVIEMIADQQQWTFQKTKYRLRSGSQELPPEYAQGFISDGLWGIVRHPNYAAEQAIWIVFYLFSVVATGNWLNWSIVGCLLLIILFKGSSDFSEEISASKYPLYTDYQKRVPRFIPWIK